MAATIERLEAEKDSITGVVITSAKKTFFAGGDLHDLKTVDHGQRGGVRRGHPRGQVAAAPPGDARQAGRRRASTARHSAGGWRSASPRTTASRVDSPSVQLGFPEVQLGLLPGAGGVVRSVRMLGIVDALMQLLMQGQRLRPAQGQGARHRRRARRHPGGPRPRRQGVDRGESGGGPAVGRQGLQDPGRHAVQPEARAEPAGVPVEPAQADQGRQLPGAAPHHGRGGRGRAGRLRHRAGDRGPLLRGPRHRPGREEHDPGVLLRPAAGQRRSRPAGGHRALQGHEGRRPRRRHDGRRHRVRLREGRHRGRAQGRRAGRRRQGQGRTRRRWSRRPSRAAARRRSRPTRCWRGSRRRTTRPRPTARTS